MHMRQFALMATVASLAALPARVLAQDVVPGNAVNPRTVGSATPADPAGIGIVESSRSPTGLLTIAPRLAANGITTASGLRIRASVQLGAVGLDGNDGIAKFREYKDLPSGGYLNNFSLMLEQPRTGFHADVAGGGLTRTDQFVGVDIGRYNSWRVRGHFSETPHVFTSAYRSVWTGFGTGNLTLSGLTPGGTTNAATTQTNILQALSSASRQSVELTREKSRARLDFTLPADWRAFASYTRERRQGSRPFGAVFGGGGGGGNIEIVEPIDYSTQDVVAGLQYGGAQTSLSVQASSSTFTNDIDTMTFENPLFITTNTIAGVAATTFTRGQFDLYPSNTHARIRAEIAQRLPRLWRGRLTGLLSIGRSRQDDALVPWALEPLTGGTINTVSTANVWNTTSALPQASARSQIDTTLADVGLLLNPTRDLAVRAKMRVYDTDNASAFLACNPLTGQFGRLINNGSGGAFVVPNQTAGNNPAGTPATGYNGTACNLASTRALGFVPSSGDLPIASAPYAYRQTNASMSADYRLGRANSIDAAYERENYRRNYRERSNTWEDKFRLGYVNRAFSVGSLRVGYDYGRRRGSEWISHPLNDVYSISLGSLPTAAGTAMERWLRNVDQFRRYDVADRDQRALNARFNHGIGPALDASVALQVRDIEYPNSEYGRNGRHRVTSPSVELNWQMTPTSNAFVFYGRQIGRQHQDGVQNGNCTMGNFYYFFSDGTTQNNNTGVAPTPPSGTSLVTTERVTVANWRTLCGPASPSSPLFTSSRSWDVSQRDRNSDAGFGLHHEIGRVLAELNYSQSVGRTAVSYGYNAAALGMNAAQVAAAGSGYADMRFNHRLAEASAVVPLVRRLSLRLLYRFEKALVRDWHYDGTSLTPMPANNAAYLDAGPEDYKVHFFGALFRYEL